jgi:hypothetical protein
VNKYIKDIELLKPILYLNNSNSGNCVLFRVT